MRHISILVLVSFISILDCFPQRVTFEDLKYVLYHDLDDYESLMIKKGFLYDGISDIGGADAYNYRKNSPNSLQYISISKFLYKDYSYEAYLFTVLQNDYAALKARVKTLNFKLTATMRDKTDTRYTYIKDNLKVEFVSGMDPSGIPVYTISLIDIKLSKQRWDEGLDQK